MTQGNRSNFIPMLVISDTELPMLCHGLTIPSSYTYTVKAKWFRDK